ncbi:Mss4-like protein [Pyrenochaeta sp. MPI-SDFR-AT-0127]|nr:Mss4-like protein [Pyrenochaeta sp. MPI-SDFR-AT-0127]
MASNTTELTGNPNSHDTSEFSDGMSATCLCGSIKVTINDKELFSRKRGHLCHCANCRKVAGSYVSTNLAIEKEKVIVDDPKDALRRYRDYATASGKCVERCFCGSCGNPIMSIAEIYPTMVIVKMGIFPRIPDPECESFALHRHAWQGKHGDLPQFETLRGGKRLDE